MKRKGRHLHWVPPFSFVFSIVENTWADAGEFFLERLAETYFRAFHQMDLT
jgi:hypothetical protein